MQWLKLLEEKGGREEGGDEERRKGRECEEVSEGRKDRVDREAVLISKVERE